MPVLPYVCIVTALFFAGFGVLAAWHITESKEDQAFIFVIVATIGLFVGIGMQSYANAHAPDPDCICESQP